MQLTSPGGKAAKYEIAGFTGKTTFIPVPVVTSIGLSKAGTPLASIESPKRGHSEAKGKKDQLSDSE